MSNINLTSDELEAMLDRAARRGAKEALRSIGLLDDQAHKDITEMRSLIEAWRDTRKAFNNKSSYSSSTDIHCWCCMDDGKQVR